MLALWLWLCVALGAEAETVEDPRQLEAAAELALAGGDAASAETLFGQMLEAQELRRYLKYRDPLKQALVLERLGRTDEAAAAYREHFDDDVLFALLVLRILSVHPDRDALVEEGIAHVRDVVERAQAGEQARIYRTSKGADRYLRPITQADLAATPTQRYCYLDVLDVRAWQGPLPELELSRCVIGRIEAGGVEIPKFVLKGIVLGDVNFGRSWEEGKKNVGRSLPPSTVGTVQFRETVILGRTNFAGVEIRDKALFPMAVFGEAADFKGAEVLGPTDFRFASFGEGADFKDARLHDAVYFGGSRFRADTTFTELYSARDVLFNSAVFEGSVDFAANEWERGATFEDARFLGEAHFTETRVAERMNLSRAVFSDRLSFEETRVGALDAFGAHFQAEALFQDATIEGRTRFSLDRVTRDRGERDLDALLHLYRDYQGDEDADEPLTTSASYGVTDVEDLTARIDGDISFANTVFGGIAMFEGVTFGQEAQPGKASFYNAQFLGETHFEHTTWHGTADFTTFYGVEVAFNGARFQRSLVLDDANLNGRLTLTDASFAPGSDWSWYAAEVRSSEIHQSHVTDDEGEHRLFYERCALGDVDRSDERIVRIERRGAQSDEEIREICYGYVIDELVALKESFGDRAMIEDEDDAWWWIRHHETMSSLRLGSFGERVWAAGKLFLFELCFGWGVKLQNLGYCSIGVTFLFAWIYRRFCPDTVLAFDGEDIKVRDVSFGALVFVSAQSMLAINTGWDFGDDDHRFRVLNTVETLIGVIILTFFVGAYTRQILA